MRDEYWYPDPKWEDEDEPDWDEEDEDEEADLSPSELAHKADYEMEKYIDLINS